MLSHRLLPVLLRSQNCWSHVYLVNDMKSKMTSKSKQRPEVVLHSRKLACENTVFQVFLDHIVAQDGTSVEDYLVVAPRNKTEHLVTGVSVLPIVGDKIGLIRIYRHAIEDYSWEVPRGFVETGESEISSAIRELKEETGLECAPEDMVSLGYILPEPGILAARVQLFAAMNCTKPESFEATELGHKESRLVNLTEARSMIETSVLQDPSTIISYYRFLEFCSVETAS